jgi:hypothetical protein
MAQMFGQPAPQPVLQFGEYPIHIGTDPETGDYAVEPQDQEYADSCGVTPTFGPDRLDIMKARAYAHGFTFVYPQSEEIQS